MSKNSRKSQEKTFAEMLKKTNGKSFIAITHQSLYGPLRGLNFVLKNTKPKEVLDFIDSSFSKPSEDIERMVERVKTQGPNPKNLQDTLVKVWLETGLMVIPQILPFEMVEQAENPPEEVESIEDGLKKVNQNLRYTTQLQKKDPFFFRKGII